jgi:hypothetical protein
VLSVVPDSLDAQAQQAVVNPAYPVVTPSQNLDPLVTDGADNSEVQPPQASPLPEHDVVPDSLVCHSPPPPLLPPASLVKQEAATDEVSLILSGSPPTRLIPAEETSHPLSSTGSPTDPMNNHRQQVLEHQPGLVGPTEAVTSHDSPRIKEESQELGIGIAVNERLSQRSSTSSLGKRRRSRLGEFYVCRR